MDPDVILVEMRELSAAILASGGEWSMADDLAQRFEALDGWLTARGFLPADWAHPQPVQEPLTRAGFNDDGTQRCHPIDCDGSGRSTLHPTGGCSCHVCS